MSDPRFARLKSDPRFRRPRKKESKVVVDERFKSVFAEEKKKKGQGKSGQVDKYGRPLSRNHEQDNLRRFYRLESGSQEEPLQALPDYARGEVLLESSDEEEGNSSDPGDIGDSTNIVTTGNRHSRPIPVDDEQAEVDLDESDLADLDAQVTAYNEVHPDTPQEEGSRSCRLAVVNLDWDHVRAGHLYKICSSLVSPTAPAVFNSSNILIKPDRKRSIKNPSSNVIRGKVISVRIYPSEFGKERMAREETEGPPAQIFKKANDIDEEVTAQNIYDVRDEDDYDEDALRKYQLERLRYYYAIIECDTIDAATHIYQELESTELERSANVFDLSFVPEDMTFDNECRDEATAESSSAFKSVDFVTDALRHSKVKLTWDEDDPERNQMTRRRLSKKEIEDADFKAYLASSSSESEGEEDQLKNAEPTRKHKSKGVSRDKLRALLLAGDGDDLPEGWSREDDDAGDVDMEITFTPGLSEKKNEDETTLDKYQRRVRDKRKKRKEEVKEKTASGGGVHDGFFEDGERDEDTRAEPSIKSKPAALTKQKQQDALSEPIIRPLPTAEELALLVASDNANEQPRHFNLKSVLKAEKKSKQKTKKRKKREEEREDDLQEDFSINVNDDRFKALHEDHQYAIDPSNPQFKKTKAMAALLEERTQRQKSLSNRGLDDIPSASSVGNGQKSLRSLVENVKRRSINADLLGTGKRRKL